MTAPTPASELETLAICERILGYLQTKRWSIAFAESLTAGYACGTLARVSGISAVLRGGIVAYDIPAKVELLQVDEATARACHAVSEATAREMAEGARRRFAVEVACSTTGFAEAWETGEGATHERFEPQAWIAVVGPDLALTRRLDLRAESDREACRRRVVFELLRTLEERLAASTSA